MNGHDKICFVIMPIKKRKSDYEDLYKNHLKLMIEHRLLSVKCIRADEKPTVNKTKIEEIKDLIRKSTFAIADISEENPNVYFEIGYAMALGKTVILIKNKQIGKLPFDIQPLDVLVYDKDRIGYNDIKRQIIAALYNGHLGYLIKQQAPNSHNKRIKANTIVGKWNGCYWVNDIKHFVILYIDNDLIEKYSALCVVNFELGGLKYRICETMRYNDKLKSLEWSDGKWIEFIGTTYTCETDNKIDYWMDAYAINADSNGTSLHIKVWDNVNRERQDVLFERIV